MLRLSPRVHQMMDVILRGETDDLDRAEIVQAYSTYLHETLHWWQHIGSSAGLILSLAYPAQVLGSMEFARFFGQTIGAVEAIKAWELRAELNGQTQEDPPLRAANIAVNNTLDIGYYTQIAVHPRRAAPDHATASHAEQRLHGGGIDPAQRRAAMPMRRSGRPHPSPAFSLRTRSAPRCWPRAIWDLKRARAPTKRQIVK